MAYPNPTNGTLNVQLIPSKIDETAIIRELTFYNLQGLPVKSIHNLEAEQLSIDLTGLTTGLYYMKAIDQAGTISEGKVLVAE